MFKKIKNKKASVTIITIFAIMCFLFPMLGIIYDIGLMHIYKQDLKNIQDLSGTVCTPVAENKGFNTNCDKLAKAYVRANLTGKYNQVGQMPEVGNLGKEAEKIQKYRKMGELPKCSDDKSMKSRICTETNDIEIHTDYSERNKLKIQIKNLKYRPMILTSALFSFAGVQKFNKQDNTYLLEIPASHFSATYSYNGK